jgi:hypothetical protein
MAMGREGDRQGDLIVTWSEAMRIRVMHGMLWIAIKPYDRQDSETGR